MPDTDLLRASRDGDQFHYHWAARQALTLLLPGADLTAIAVEGVSHDDTQGRDGEDVIDIAEYYGATGLREANRVVYRQLKHSTTRATEEWTVSGLGGTVSGFAEKCRRIRLDSPGLERKVTFEFLSNRPVRDSVLRAIRILAVGGEPGEYAHEVKFLRQYAGFTDDADGEAGFFNQLEVDPTAPGLLRLEGLFRLDLAGFSARRLRCAAPSAERDDRETRDLARDGSRRRPLHRAYCSRGSTRARSACPQPHRPAWTRHCDSANSRDRRRHRAARPAACHCPRGRRCREISAHHAD